MTSFHSSSGVLPHRCHRTADAGVGEHDVDAPELLLGAADHTRHVGLGAGIGRETLDRRADLLGQRLQARLVPVGCEDPGSFLDEALDGRASDSARRTGDYRTLSLEASHGTSSRADP
jgi:hypothetical protein